MALFDRFSGKSEEEIPEAKEDMQKVQSISMDSIIANRYQPRTEFDNDAIVELSKTIQEHGLLQPIVVREYENQKYEIIAGERRFRATKLLGWTEIKAIVNNLTDSETASMALIENLQRENLNPIEEAVAYQELMRVNDLTQSELSEQLGKSQSYVANKLRLLKLDTQITNAIANNKITQRHGRALLALDKEQQIPAFNQIQAEDMNVKQTEVLINKLLTVNGKPKSNNKRKPVTLTKNMKLSVNTIKKSVSMIKDTGMKVETVENDNDDEYEIIIRIKK
ncbi:nucleoid occlusion protein [Companilactobacillus sp. RD055328]|uniref:nucleoid occlusion protein n=1 Tax=Companilactobacillus sp. RD055328 TaxID=2916634 RepID=UPI001FC80169|nr:nucleoid occlusion protein [Companilactobacillus sp. RD055328]GKQ43460.1 nucleoid occlusion protein [Companilactobacillus sp. RD055328]